MSTEKWKKLKDEYPLAGSQILIKTANGTLVSCEYDAGDFYTIPAALIIKNPDSWMYWHEVTGEAADIPDMPQHNVDHLGFSWAEDINDTYVNCLSKVQLMAILDTYEAGKKHRASIMNDALKP